MKIFYRFTDWLFGVRRFIQTAYHFRKQLYTYYSWDYSSTLELLKASIQLNYNTMLTSDELDEFLQPKLKSMQDSIQILDRILQDDYMSRAEQILQKKFRYPDIILNERGSYRISEPEDSVDVETNREILDLAVKLQQNDWQLLWKLIRGDKRIAGSDIRSWWR